MTKSAIQSDKPGLSPTADRTVKSGVTGIYDPKWIFVALCYVAAIALMGQDPWYGDKQFTYNQGILSGFCHF